MSSIDAIEKLGNAFHWAAREAEPLMRKSIDKNLYRPAIDARMFCIAQIITSIVAILFIFWIAAPVIMLWNFSHIEIKEGLWTIPAAAKEIACHIFAITSCTIASLILVRTTLEKLDYFPHIINAEAKKT
jgi:hypothetical protein